jgi:hypothetical protein
VPASDRRLRCPAFAAHRARHSRSDWLKLFEPPSRDRTTALALRLRARIGGFLFAPLLGVGIARVVYSQPGRNVQCRDTRRDMATYSILVSAARESEVTSGGSAM